MQNHLSRSTLAAVALGLATTPALAGPDWVAIEQARAAKRSIQAQVIQPPCAIQTRQERVAFPYGPHPHPRPQATSSQPCVSPPVPVIAVDTPHN
jgi:hypothetical protein